MPLQGFKISDDIQRITFKDILVFNFNELVKDEKIIYPITIFTDFVNYLQKEYKSGVFGERFVRDNENTSHIDLIFYVPEEYKTKDINIYVNEFLKKYPDELISIELSTGEDPKTGKPSYSRSTKEQYPLPASLDKLNKEQLELAKKLFRINWGAEPNLEDPDDQEELYLLFKMNQEALRSHYTIKAKMNFNNPSFSPKTKDRVEINLLGYFVHDNKIKNNNKSKGDEMRKVTNFKEFYNNSKLGDWIDFNEYLGSTSFYLINLGDGKFYYYDSDGGDGIETKEEIRGTLLDYFGDDEELDNQKVTIHSKEEMDGKLKEDFKQDLKEYGKEYLKKFNFLNPDFSDNKIKNNNKSKGDIKMRKDADERLALVEQIKKHCAGDCSDYDVKDEFVQFVDGDLCSYNRNDIMDNDWLDEYFIKEYFDLEETPSPEKIKKLVKDLSGEEWIKMMKKLSKYHGGPTSIDAFNTAEGLREILRQVKGQTTDSKMRKDSNESKQSEIARAFAKRYKK